FTITIPCDYKVALGVHGRVRPFRVAPDIGVNLEFAPLRHAVVVVTLSVDAPTKTILKIGGPSDDKVSVVVHRHGRQVLVARGISVDSEFTALTYALVVV